MKIARQLKMNSFSVNLKIEDNLPGQRDIQVKCSDFSIDHILNRAGSKHSVGERIEKYQIESEFFDRSKDFSMDESQMDQNSFTPILHWLQYTRYHPPKLPRPAKSGPVKRTPGRLPRIPFTPYQLSELENAYKKASYMSSEDANRLAIKLDLTCTRVKIWFQNRRARERRECREKMQSSQLPPSP